MHIKKLQLKRPTSRRNGCLLSESCFLQLESRFLGILIRLGFAMETAARQLTGDETSILLVLLEALKLF